MVKDDEEINLSMAKVFVFSDSVLCLGKGRPFPPSNDEWETKLQWLKNSKHYRELDRIDGKPMEFEWKNHSGVTKIFFEIQKVDIKNWIGDPHNEKVCVANSILVASFAKSFFWTLVIPRAWIRNEMECNGHLQTWRRMGSSDGNYDAQFW